MENVEIMGNVMEMIMSLGSNFFSIILAIVAIVGQWKIFEKAGEEGWKAIIPFYNEYTLFKVSGTKTKWFFVKLIMTIIAVIDMIAMGIFSAIVIAASVTSTTSSDSVASAVILLGIVSIIAIIVLLATAVVSLIVRVMIARNLSAKFGKSSGYAVGLFLVPSIFYIVLGFDNSQYIKENVDENNEENKEK